ncbi:MAG: TlyA family rRNA (cytidine-2'-O)-methyltransferase [Spirochaetales bacterium]|nr:TlyA family rRNA (cytidine-2'-O)-methyltransferase [Spirochaetales bacterium]
MKGKKLPIIKVLTEKFYEYTEKEFYAMIMCGEVSVDGETIRSSQQKVDPEKEIVFRRRRFVSRGGDKLDFALAKWDIQAEGRVVLDAGASTGGFTDCLLRRGALRVHSVDVGFNQLDYNLRTDPRVNVLEKTNIMSISVLEPPPHFAVADLSFRSITGAASLILKLTTQNLLIALVKPQFELVQDDDFDGIIRDKAVLESVVRDTARRLGDDGIKVEAVLESPIKGQKGNTEYLFRLSQGESGSNTDNILFLDTFFNNQF